MSNSKIILVAAHQLRGGNVDGKSRKQAVLEAGEELTAAKKKALGLDDETIATLIENGALIEQSARMAEGASKSDDAALTAAADRATKAEAEVGVLKAKVAELEKQLEEATKPKA